MGQKKKKIVKILEEIQAELLNQFKGRLSYIGWHRPAEWEADAHSDAELVVMVRRYNQELASTIYDVVYKIMVARNFDQVISLYITEENLEQKLKTMDNSFTRYFDTKGVVLWRAG